LSTSDNTATAGSDYTATSTTIAFAAGETSKTVLIPVANDAVAEGNESLNLLLSSPVGAVLGENRAAVLTITDNDSPGTLGFNAATYSVGEGTATKTITVSRSDGSAGTVTVDWSAASNTATLGTDFTAAGGTLTFGPGVLSRTFTVNVINDTDQEGNESLHLTLSNPTGGAVLGAVRRAILTIVDNDVPTSGIQFAAASYTTSEGGSKAITITRPSGATEQSVTFTTADNGTAVAGADYTAVTQTVNFAIGETSKTVNVPITADTLPESNESVNLSLSDSSGGATLGVQRTAVLVITDNDLAGTLTFKQTAFTVSEAASTATITVTRNASAGAVTVDYATSDNTAVAGSDYTATSGTLSFAPGQTTRTFTVPVTYDALAEGPESLNLTLSNATGGATLGQNRRAVLIITDKP
jgi:hypothetical protein